MQVDEVACSTKIKNYQNSFPISGQINDKHIHINDLFDINYFEKLSLGELTIISQDNLTRPTSNNITLGQQNMGNRQNTPLSSTFPNWGGEHSPMAPMPLNFGSHGSSWPEYRNHNAEKIVRSWKVKIILLRP